MHHGGKKYGTIGSVSKRIDYDIKHGVTKGQVISFLQLIRTESSFSEVRTHDGSRERLDEMKMEKSIFRRITRKFSKS